MAVLTRLQEGLFAVGDRAFVGRALLQRSDHSEVLDTKSGAAGEEQGRAAECMACLVDKCKPLSSSRGAGRHACARWKVGEYDL